MSEAAAKENMPAKQAELIESIEDITRSDLAKVVITYPVTEDDIEMLAQQYSEVPEDLSIKENYEFVKGGLSTLRPLRTSVEAKRKWWKDPVVKLGRKIDSSANVLKDKILAIEKPLADAKKAYDTKVELEKREKAKREEERIDRIAERIAGIKALVSGHVSSTAEQIEKEINQLGKEEATFDDWAMEFSGKAEDAILASLDGLKELHHLKTQQEKLAAEQEEQRKKDEAEKAEQERIAKEEQAKREKELAEEQAKLAAEKEKMEAEKAKLEKERQKIEQERLAEEQRKQEEKARLEKEAETERIRTEQQAKEADEAKQVQQETAPTNQNGYSDDWRNAANAIKAIVGDKAKAKQLMDAITSGNIPNIAYTGE